MIRIAAVADVHYPKYADVFLKALSQIDYSEIDMFLMVGDMVFKSRFVYYANILKAVRKYWRGVIISIFGNEEYEEHENEIVRKFSDVLWLRDESKALIMKGTQMCIVGSRGTIEKPTSWQARNIPNIIQIYKERERRIMKLINRAKSQGMLTVLVTHYAPTYVTLFGEKREAWPFLGSLRMEKVIKMTKPDLVIHGHAHNSKRNQATIDEISVYNVSIPATKRISIIEVSGRRLEDLSPLFRY